MPNHTATLDHIYVSYSAQRSDNYLDDTVMACLLCNRIRAAQSILDDPQGYLQSVIASQKNILRKLMPMANAAPINAMSIPETA